jgi:hypothetical protein
MRSRAFEGLHLGAQEVRIRHFHDALMGYLGHDALKGRLGADGG